MSQRISLAEAERRAFRATFQDGLWDVLLGCFFLMFAIAPLLSKHLGDFWSSAVFVPFWALAYLVIYLVRRQVVIPRMGVARFGPTRRVKLLWLNVVLFVVFLAGLVVSLLTRGPDAGVWMRTLPFGLIVALVFLVTLSAAAFFLDFPRLYIYGVLAGLAPVVGDWLYVQFRIPHHGFPLTFGIASGIMILTGLIIFVRFVRSHPIPTPEAPSGEA
jgi:hypothetical protein